MTVDHAVTTAASTARAQPAPAPRPRSGAGRATAPGRRTQADRSAGTRQVLLDAALECLVELGYARTTSRGIALRAGVSRGAQTHHFPTKDELVVAAVEHLFAVQTRRFAEVFGALPAERRTLDEAVRLLWDGVRDPAYAAVLEVVVAARTDPSLRDVVHDVSARLEVAVADLVAELVPDLGDERVRRALVAFGLMFVQGAAVASYAGFGDPDATVRLVRALASAVTPATAPMVEGALDALDR